MSLSIMVALVLSPSLCVTLLKPVEKGHRREGRFFTWFNRNFDRFREWYRGTLNRVLGLATWVMIAFAAIVALLAFLFYRMPTGSCRRRTRASSSPRSLCPPARCSSAPWRWRSRWGGISWSMRKPMWISPSRWRASPSPARDRMRAWPSPICATGASARDRRTRPRPSPSAPSSNSSTCPTRRCSRWCRPRCRRWANPPGFDIELEDRGNLGHAGLIQARNQLLGLAAKNPKLLAVRPNRPGRHAPASLQYRPGQGQCAGGFHRLRQLHPQRRLGRLLRQQFHRPRPRQARLYAGRCALPHDAGGHRPAGMCATPPAR